MKRLVLVTMIVVLPAATGCCRAWPRFWSLRGDQCEVCHPYDTTTTYGGVLMAPGPPVEDMPPPASGP